MRAVVPPFVATFLFVFLVTLPGSFNADAAEQAGPSQAAEKAGQVYLEALSRAAQAYSQRQFTEALERLAVADNIQPDVPDTWNMRGAIYAEERAYEKAEDAFSRAAQLDPGNFWPKYNLAQLLFMQKKYDKAEAAFEPLVSDPKHQELVQFKLVLLDLLQGNGDKAKAVLDSMKEPSETPAFYFAHAAWEYAHQNTKQGQYWVDSGLKIFEVAKTYTFYDTLSDLGWVPKRTPAGLGHASPGLGLPMATPDVH